MYIHYIICLMGMLLTVATLPAQVHKQKSKAVIKTEAHYVFDQEDEGKVIDTVKIWCAGYNRNGDVLWDSSFDSYPSSNVTYCTQNTYNKKGIITSSVIKQYDYDNDSKDEFITYMYYDRNGNDIKEIDYDKGKLNKITNFLRDTNGDLLRENILEPDNTLTYFIIRKCDTVHRILVDSNVTSRTDSNGYRHFYSDLVIVYYRNIRGDDSIILRHDRMKGFSTKTVNTYTPQGWLAEHTVYNTDKDTTVIRDVYTYNSAGQVMKEVKFEAFPTQADTITYKYNSNGDCIEQNDNGYIQTNRYTYYK
jgi:hypothetical protein